MSEFQPSRILNEASGFLGLSSWDLAGLGYGLMGLHSVLSNFGWELLAFPIVGVLGLFLIQVRNRHRKKFFRDMVRSYFWRFRV